MCCGHLDDFAHERGAFELAVFHLRELELPFGREFGRGKLGYAEAVQQRHQRERLRGWDQFLALAIDVALGDQPLDDGCARRRRAQALLAHRLAQFVVLDGLAGAFHRRQQRGFAEARRRLGDQRLDVDLLGRDFLVGQHGHQRGFVALRFLAVDGEPAGRDQHLAFGLERLVLDAGDARGDEVLGGRVEHREEAAHDQVVKLGSRPRSGSSVAPASG